MADFLHLEHRHAERAPAQRLVHFRTDAGYRAGTSWDISEGGMYIESSARLKAGAVITLCVCAEEGTPSVIVHGEVRWVSAGWEGERPPGMGVRFVDLPMGDGVAMADEEPDAALEVVARAA